MHAAGYSTAMADVLGVSMATSPPATNSTSSEFPAGVLTLEALDWLFPLSSWLESDLRTLAVSGGFELAPLCLLLAAKANSL